MVDVDPSKQENFPNRYRHPIILETIAVIRRVKMTALGKQVVALFVDRRASSGSCGIPKATSGFFLPSKNPWEHRQPFYPTDETDLEPVPGHYKDMLGLPF